MLNAAETRCDALILFADVDHVIHVPLPGFDFQRATRLQNTVQALLGHARVTRLDDRKGKLSTGGVAAGNPSYLPYGTESSNQSWTPWPSQYVLSCHMNS